MAEPMTARHFAEKVQWEGGIVEALDYGLTPDHIDPNDPAGSELRRLWTELHTLWRTQMAPLVERIDSIIDDLETVAAADEDGEEDE